MPSQESELERLAAASAWRVTLSEAGVESSEAFEAWLGADDRNGRAWTQVEGPWRRFSEEATAPELMLARRNALDRARREQRRRWSRWRASPGLAIAASAAAVVLIVLASWNVARPQVYATALGERRAITLQDGSHVDLDSDSLLTVKLLRGARELDLIRGQARFDVAHDRARPFSVKARDEVVVATGTSFNVDLFGPKVVVTLIQGRVSVLTKAPQSFMFADTTPPPERVRLIAGQQLTLLADVSEAKAFRLAPQVVNVSLDQAISWETGQLIFDDERLSDVAKRVSRYTARPLVIRDARIGALRISGVFKAGDVDTFVDAVTHYLPVSAANDADGSIELRQKD